MPRFSEPPTAITTPARTRTPRPYRRSKYSGTVITRASRSRATTKPVCPTANATAIVMRPTTNAENPARKPNCAWYA